MKDKPIANLTLARQIRAARRPIHIAEDDGEPRGIPADGLRVFQWGGVNESSVTAITDCGGLAVILYLGITIKLPNFAISAFDLELPWKNDSFWWLPDPLDTCSNSKYYRFGCSDLPEFERSRVLNHYADVTRTHSYGQSLRGCLLGFGTDLIPEEFPHGKLIPAFVRVYDQFGREHRSPVKLWLDRSVARSRVPSRRSRLFDHLDPVR